MDKFVLLHIPEFHNYVTSDRCSIHNVMQRTDAGFGEPYQQIKVSIDNVTGKILKLELIEGEV